MVTGGSVDTTLFNSTYAALADVSLSDITGPHTDAATASRAPSGTPFITPLGSELGGHSDIESNQ